ncbi:hypothetical protein ACP4OV_014060 [Aristida adscensionis]
MASSASTTTTTTALLLLLLAGVVLGAARPHVGGGAGAGDDELLEGQRCDLVEELPGQPPELSFRQFSGYVTVNESHGRALFYWFVEADCDVRTKPLVLWLNGGPGCSSLGYGAMQELGPLLIQKGTPELRLNPESWNKEANMLFLESPAGVGFSYTNTSEDLRQFGDNLTADDAYTFLVNWFERFPHMKAHEFYLAGESYAGHYVPQLAEKIVEMNKQVNESQRINFKGFMIGNAAVDDASDDRGMVDYAWDHAIISDELYAAIGQECDFARNNGSSDFAGGDRPPSAACIRAMNAFYAAFNDIDIYSLYTPVCTDDTTSSSSSSRARQLARRGHHLAAAAAAGDAGHGRRLARRLRYSDYDPCLDEYTVAYLNRADVQAALHANVSGAISYPWDACSEALFRGWRDSPATTLPAIKRMVDAGLRVWVYSGDTDARVPVTSTRYALRKLGLATAKPWREWFTSEQVGGYTAVYDGGLTYATVRGAGHMVPTITPVQARQLFAHFLAGKELPARPVEAKAA